MFRRHAAAIGGACRLGGFLRRRGRWNCPDCRMPSALDYFPAGAFTLGGAGLSLRHSHRRILKNIVSAFSHRSSRLMRRDL
jgi:hypothetical protein